MFVSFFVVVQHQYTVRTAEFMSFIDQQAQGTIQGSDTAGQPKISDQGGAVAGATHTLDLPEISHTQASVQVGANAPP